MEICYIYTLETIIEERITVVVEEEAQEPVKQKQGVESGALRYYASVGLNLLSWLAHVTQMRLD